MATRDQIRFATMRLAINQAEDRALVEKLAAQIKANWPASDPRGQHSLICLARSKWKSLPAPAQQPLPSGRPRDSKGRFVKA